MTDSTKERVVMITQNDGTYQVMTVLRDPHREAGENITTPQDCADLDHARLVGRQIAEREGLRLVESVED